MPFDLVDHVKPLVDKTIDALEAKEFRVDPIGGERFSRQTSIISSAYKRHGKILETAIRERLARSEYFTVWQEPEFRISDVADRAIQGRNTEIPDSSFIELPYGEFGRSIQVDVLVYDSRIRSFRAYEVKRGNGSFDAGKKRSILRDTLCTQALLRSYGSKRNLNASVVEAKVICYFGVRALPEPYCLVSSEIDDHFVFPVRGEVERVNQYFKEKLYLLIEKVSSQVDLDFEGLCPTCPLKQVQPNKPQ